MYIFPFLPLGGDNFLFKSLLPHPLHDFQRYTELCQSIKVSEIPMLFHWWHAISPDEFVRVNSYDMWYSPLFFREIQGIFSFCVNSFWAGMDVGVRLWIKREQWWLVRSEIHLCQLTSHKWEKEGWWGWQCCPSFCQDMLQTSSHFTDMRLKYKKHKNGINY